MEVSVEALEGLERKLTVLLPAEKVEAEVDARLKKLARTTKMDGFRPGKVPFQIVVKRYSDEVRQDVARELVQSSLYEAISKKELSPAGYPNIDSIELEPGKDLKYTATFEIYPEIEVQEFDGEQIEIIQSEVKAADANKMIENLRKQNQTWKSVQRKVKDGDKVIIDFEGFVDGEAFEGGKAEGYEVVIGAETMIPGFEQGIIGAAIGKEMEINVTFPKDYNHEKLAGKDAMFKITVHEVFEGDLPPLDESFFEKFGIKEGGLDALKKDIRENMERMLERQVSSMNRDKVFKLLIEKNSITIPKALIENEISSLKHEMYHRIFGPKHSENEKIPDFPRELFEADATRRVHLGLVFSAYVKKHQMVVDKARIDDMINKLAGAYEDSSEFRESYYKDKQQMEQIEALVLEEMVSDKLLESLKVKEKKMSYEAIMNPQKNKEDQGE